MTFTTPNRPALMRPVPPPSTDAGSSDGEAAENIDQETGDETPDSGYLHLLMPVRLPG